MQDLQPLMKGLLHSRRRIDLMTESAACTVQRVLQWCDAI